jgi:hypothetical protein
VGAPLDSHNGRVGHKVNGSLVHEASASSFVVSDNHTKFDPIVLISRTAPASHAHNASRRLMELLSDHDSYYLVLLELHARSSPTCWRFPIEGNFTEDVKLTPEYGVRLGSPLLCTCCVLQIFDRAFYV